MAEPIRYYRGAFSAPLPGRFGAHIHWQGFALERHDIPAGEYGDSEFHGHLVALERNPEPYLLSTKGTGPIHVTPGAALVRSQQPIRSLRLTGTQQCLALMIDPHAMESALPEPFKTRPVELPDRSIGCDVFVNHVMSAMEFEMKAGAPGGPLLFESLGKSVALYLASRQSAHPFVLPARPFGLSRDRLSRVTEYIHTHLASDLALEDLAGVACLSTYHFARMFKASTGQSVHQYVLQQRIERAKVLIRRKNLTLAEIAGAVGFSDQSQFTTAFRRIVHVTPGAWRLARR